MVPPPATEYLDMATAVLIKQVLHVGEELHMSALIGRDGDALHILFDRRFHDLRYGPVVSEMDDLGPHALQDPAHDVDGGVMAVKKTCGGDQANFVMGGVHKLTTVR